VHDKLRTVVVDASPGARGMMEAALQADASIELVAVWDRLDSVMTLVKHHTPPHCLDVMVLDMGLKNAPDILSQVLSLRPKINIILLGDSSGEKASLVAQALQNGAAEFMVKVPPEAGSEGARAFTRNLVDCVQAFRPVLAPAKALSAQAPLSATPLQFKPKPAGFLPKALAIASSTGGPKAVLRMVEMLKGRACAIPVFITQHMPKEFTPHFAKQIEAAGGFPAHEGKEAEEVLPGQVYVAPGDYHMGVRHNAQNKVVIHLSHEAPENYCRPAADPMLRSLVEVYGGQVLLVVLTGMGKDGLKGAEELVKAGGVVLAQDQATSVVWGMPGAVATAGLAHRLYPIEGMADAIIEHAGGRVH
jgi:two-component system chemotaxis response regulator CheB